MRVVVCGSMTFSKRMIEVERKLVELGHEIVLPKFIREYAKLESNNDMHKGSAKNKVKYDLIRDYFKEISNADAILVVNERRNGVDNYVGGNSFLEMGFAHVLNKKIFLLNPIPDIGCKDEIEAMQPIVINKNLRIIK